MKDLKLKVGDKCYIGREEWECVLVDSSKQPYKIENSETDMWITADGRPDVYFNIPSIVSLGPYDFPEMVYENPLEIGKPHYFWGKGHAYPAYALLGGTQDGLYLTKEGHSYTYCSPTPPELPIKK